MKLIICLLTHNRPRSFKRSIQSIIDSYNYRKRNFDIEIIVNNDSNDIKELYYDNIKTSYYYKQYKCLSQSYVDFFNMVGDNFIYFFEDDDILTNNFFDNINLNFDVNLVDYKIHKEFLKLELKDTKHNEIIKQRKFKNYKILKEFLKHNKLKFLQMSQFILNCKKFNLKYFIDNKNKYQLRELDELFLLCMDKKSSVNVINKKCYIQGYDGSNLTFVLPDYY
tara:strand:- start:9085 stop:9753 length:669 start_codon:yes stop_codon:yes gene_type:complete